MTQNSSISAPFASLFVLLSFFDQADLGLIVWWEGRYTVQHFLRSNDVELSYYCWCVHFTSFPSSISPCTPYFHHPFVRSTPPLCSSLRSVTPCLPSLPLQASLFQQEKQGFISKIVNGTIQFGKLQEEVKVSSLIPQHHSWPWSLFKKYTLVTI